MSLKGFNTEILHACEAAGEPGVNENVYVYTECGYEYQVWLRNGKLRACLCGGASIYQDASEALKGRNIVRIRTIPV